MNNYNKAKGQTFGNDAYRFIHIKNIQKTSSVLIDDRQILAQMIVSSTDYNSKKMYFDTAKQFSEFTADK